MARKKELLNDEELKVFYENYLYMWDELLTISPYEAKKNDKEGVLPAFCTLSRIYTDAKKKKADIEYKTEEKFVPTIYQVKKIVDYYNRKFTPAILPGEFIHTNLKLGYRPGITDKKIYDCFDGLYYGFYYEDQDEIHGAILRIKREKEHIRVTMVVGFDFSSIAEIEQAKKISNYTEFYQFAKSYTHFYYYEGSAVVGGKTLYISLKGHDQSERVVTLVFNVERFLDREARIKPYHYRGGLGFAMATSFSYVTASPRFYQFGMIMGEEGEIVRQQTLKSIMDSSELKELLKLKSSQKYIMTMDSDKNWFRFIKEKRV